MEELLGYFADWIGLDLQGRSTGRIIVIVALYSTAGLLLFLVGLYLLTKYDDDAVWILSGVVCALLGAVFLIRIGLNIRVLLRPPKA